jgi:hypothetical protein
VTARHLVTVWDPTFGAGVMESHLTVLLEGAAACRRKDCGADDVYVWWAKVRSPHRPEPLPHLEQVLRVGAAEGGHAADAETHLYLTDYRSLYVAHVAEVTADDPRPDEAERSHIPAYYLADGVAADCWFRLWDIRRLVSEDTVAVVHELRKLRNVLYHDNPVSIYGGMVGLPLIVTEAAPVRYFEQGYTAHFTDQKLWAEFDSERAGTRSLERDLRENLLGDEVWLGLDPVVRAFLATGERVYRDHADDPAFDLSPVVVEYAKALEVMCRGLAAAALASAPREVLQHLRERDADHLPDQWGRRPPSLSDLGQILGGSGRMRSFFSEAVRDGRWVSADLPLVLARVARLRNPAAHGQRVGRADVQRLRRELLGIGCEGAVVRLAKAWAVAA